MADPQAQLYTTDGKPVNITDSAAASQAVLAGQIAPQKGTRVAIIRPDTHEMGEVPAEELHGALSSGATLAPTAEYHKAQLEAKWGDQGGMSAFKNWLLTAGAGAARGATMGLSDVAITEGAKALLPPAQATRTREFLRDMKDLHPIVSGVGEAAGLIAATAATGGEAGLAEGTELAGAKLASGGLRTVARYTPSGLLDALGGAVESRIAAGTEQALGKGIGARILARGAAGVGRGATEGAAWGLGQAVSEASLGDERLTAEKALAHIKHDALLFGGIGGALGVGTGLLEGAASKLAPRLTREADQQTVRILNPTMGAARMANKGEEGIEGLGNWLRQKVPPRPGESVESYATRLEEYGANFGTRFDSISGRVGKDPLINTAEIVDNIRGAKLPGMNASLGELEKIPGMKNIAGHVNQYLEELTAAGNTLTFEQARTFRIGFDKVLDPAFRSANPAFSKQVDMAIRNAFEGSIEKAVDKVGAGVEGLSKGAKNAANDNGAAVSELLQDYKDVKKDWGYWKQANKMAETAQLKDDIVLRKLSMSDYFGGVKGAIVGAATGHGLIGAALGVAANKMMRTRGNSTAAWALGKLSDLATLRSFVDGTTLNIQTGAKAFVRGKPNVFKIRTFEPAESKQEPLGARYAKVVGLLSGASADPAKVVDNLGKATAGMMETAPNIQQSMVQTVTNGLAFLNTKVPQAPNPNSAQPSLSKPVISDSEKAAFLKYADGTWNPLSAVEDMAAGKVAPQKIEALKAVHPELYKNIQIAVMEELGKMTAEGKELPYQKRLQLGLLFDLPADESMRPESIAALQQNFGPPPQQGPGRPPGSSGAVGKITSLFGTAMDKRANAPH